mmetsp:Transcript_57123/g.124132  ORF Transcript_57123/g.124132 Transcript_57123/m.124132 type:complete len:92 (+) Transcript_57123:178-453(+)|eukprot:208484-Pleurochrysis_carterae.AAC.1
MDGRWESVQYLLSSCSKCIESRLASKSASDSRPKRGRLTALALYGTLRNHTSDDGVSVESELLRLRVRRARVIEGALERRQQPSQRVQEAE